MSAFGKRNGVGGGRPSFGVAKPMKGGPAPAGVPESGGEQFPPIEELNAVAEATEADLATEPGVETTGAMDRLTARQNASGEAGSSKVEGFEASVHRIKEQRLITADEVGDEPNHKPRKCHGTILGAGRRDGIGSPPGKRSVVATDLRPLMFA